MIKKVLFAGSHSALDSLGLLLLRASAAGMMFAGHGLAKIQNFAVMKDKFPPVLGLGSPMSLSLAIFTEVACSLLVLVGLGTRVASLGVVTTMAVAMSTVHAADPLFATGQGGSKEMAMMYLIAFLPLIFTGAGRFSVDQKLGKI